MGHNEGSFAASVHTDTCTVLLTAAARCELAVVVVPGCGLLVALPLPRRLTPLEMLTTLAFQLRGATAVMFSI